MNNINGPLKVGIGGGIGTGKTSLTEALCRYLSNKVSMAVISNDIYTTEDAEYLMKAQVLPIERIKGVETGGCPHTAIREDCSINLLAVDEMKKKFPDLELILIESGGDNLKQIIWHIGNRHLPCQIEENRILIQDDAVILDMVLKLHGNVKKVMEKFNPEGGAYGLGRTHSHKH